MALSIAILISVVELRARKIIKSSDRRVYKSTFSRI